MQRPLLTPDEAMRLPEHAALIFVAGHPPIYASKIRYYDDAERSKIAPPVHSDRIEHEHQWPKPPAKASATNGNGTSGNGTAAHVDHDERGPRERDKGDLSKGWPFK